MTNKAKASQFSTGDEKLIRARIIAHMERLEQNRIGLANKLGVESSQMTRWLNHPGKLTRNAIVQIAKALNVTISDLTGIPEPFSSGSSAQTTIDDRARALEEALLAARKKLLDCELNNVELRKELLSMGRRPSV